MAAIDLVLPEWDVHEVHAVDLACEPERALEAVLGISAAPDRLVRALFRVRGLRAAPSLAEAVEALGFEVVQRSPVELVAAVAGAPWRRKGGLRRFSEAGPGTVRMAIAFRAERVADGCRLTTETRVQALDAEARRRFRRYWLVVGPFSSLVRRRWLSAVERAVRVA